VGNGKAAGRAREHQKWEKWGNTYEIARRYVKYIARTRPCSEARTRERIEEIKGKMYAFIKYRGASRRWEEERLISSDATYTCRKTSGSKRNISFQKGQRPILRTNGRPRRYAIIAKTIRKQVEFAVRGGLKRS